ncbi:MAG TPA: FtsX-like permease family protein, partial [bacterium]|nr:FtsX-like permease family protein [bacterium]
GVVIGSRLAEILEVEVGDRLVITVAQQNTGEMSQEMMRVKGIFKLGMREMDRSIALIPIKRASAMLGLNNGIHEIAVNLKKHKNSWINDNPLWEKYSKNGNLFRNWVKLLPEMEAMVSMSGFSKYIIGIVLFLLVAGIIINTLFMSIYERMFEFGVMRAIGVKPLKLGSLIVLESGVLAIFATFFGVVTSLILNGILLKTGIDYTGTEFVSVSITELIYPVISVQQYTVFPLALIIFIMITGFYPAIHAARITPANAMKKGSK